jgi:hypothetical protein
MLNCDRKMDRQKEYKNCISSGKRGDLHTRKNDMLSSQHKNSALIRAIKTP